ncbi:MAG: hypothetical protein RIQ99_1079, partial [Pseudomonadota bacterium]
MATGPISAGQRGARVDWRAAFRRSLRRAGEIAGAAGLLTGMAFLALALLSYTQTDPSLSTAAGGTVENWMGAPGAWVADALLLLFGPVCILILPLLYVMARKLWRLVEEEDQELEHTNHKWWRPLAMLLCGMWLLASVLALVIERSGSLPAGWGGITGLAGAGAIKALSLQLPPAARFWSILGLAITSLAGGAVLAGRVFAIDWGSLLTLPGAIKHAPTIPTAIPAALEAVIPRPRKDKNTSTDADLALAEPLAPARIPPVITDPTQTKTSAVTAPKSLQGDLFDTYKLPDLDLLHDAPPNSDKKID